MRYDSGVTEVMEMWKLDAELLELVKGASSVKYIFWKKRNQKEPRKMGVHGSNILKIKYKFLGYIQHVSVYFTWINQLLPYHMSVIKVIIKLPL